MLVLICVYRRSFHFLVFEGNNFKITRDYYCCVHSGPNKCDWGGGRRGETSRSKMAEGGTWFCSAVLPRSAGYFSTNTGGLVRNDYGFVWYYRVFSYYARHTQSVQHREVWVFTRNDGTWRNESYIDGSSVQITKPSGRRIFNLVQFCDILKLEYRRVFFCNKIIYTGCNRRNGPDFGRVFLRSNYTDITQNTYIQTSMVTEILAREIWNFDSYYSLIDYQIHIETGRNMWFL